MDSQYSIRRVARPWIKKSCYEQLNIFFQPHFTAETKPAALLKQHLNEVDIQDLLRAAEKGEWIDPVRYNKNLTQARRLAQKSHVLDALDDKIQWKRKSPAEQSVWTAVVEQKRPLYLHALIGQPPVDQLTFVPVLSVQRVSSGDWAVQLGVDLRRWDIPVEMSVERIITPSLRQGVAKMLSLFEQWCVAEMKLLSAYMARTSKETLRNCQFWGCPPNQSNPDQSPNSEKILAAIFLPDPNRTAPAIAIAGFGIGVIPLVTPGHYLLVLRPMGDGVTPGDLGITGRDLRFVFTSPTDRLATVYALGYLDGMTSGQSLN